MSAVCQESSEFKSVVLANYSVLAINRRRKSVCDTANLTSNGRYWRWLSVGDTDMQNQCAISSAGVGNISDTFETLASRGCVMSAQREVKMR